jgi:hypothetical protein
VLWTNIARAGEASSIEAFGCFTVGDIWTFVLAEAEVRPAGSTPYLGVTLSWSREHTESAEADAILRVRRWLVGRVRG